MLSPVRALYLFSGYHTVINPSPLPPPAQLFSKMTLEANLERDQLKTIWTCCTAEQHTRTSPIQQSPLMDIAPPGLGAIYPPACSLACPLIRLLAFRPRSCLRPVFTSPLSLQTHKYALSHSHILARIPSSASHTWQATRTKWAY